MKTILTVFFALACGITTVQAQETLKIKIAEEDSKKPLSDGTVTNKGAIIGLADSTGTVTINIPAGTYTLECSAGGHKAAEIKVTLPDNKVHEVFLERAVGELEEVTFIASTRNNQAIENSPMKVEVLGKEEVGEEVSVKPGNIASLLSDVSGVQIQQSSPVSGNSNVRIQGLQGKYTQVLRDGMPMFDGFSGGFGILTIPPLDLMQIELIKGSASTLYGGGAIGGLINLISKKPTFNQEAEALVNYSTLNEADVNTYFAKRYKKVGYTFFAGYVNQQAKDVNGDGLSDVPNISSVVVHPTVFFYPSDKTIISVGYTGTFDNRKGGDMKVLNNQGDSIHQYYERNVSQRHSGEYILDHFFANNAKLTVKGVASQYDLNTTTNTYNLKGNQLTYYNEVSLYQPIGKGSLVAGVNVSGNNYNTTVPANALISSMNNFTSGVFAQYSLVIKAKTNIEAGIRVDDHNKYGFFTLPRLAIFHRFNEQFACRAGFGMGYKTPNPLEPQDIDYNPLTILPAGDNVNAELSYGYNAEGNFKKEWDKKHKLFINHAFFLTQINNPIVFETNAANNVVLVNASKPIQTMGFDTYLKMTLDKWEIYGGYTYTDARRTYLTSQQFVPLTPRNRMAFVIVREIEEKWRFGLEGSYNGPQYRYDGTMTPAYLISALMIMHNLNKHVTLVLNCENLLNYKMTGVESVYTGSISDPTFKPLWAPVDGRVANFSVRWKL